jgi:formate-dependent nitrite reductase membrane component NrfD
MVLSFRFVFCLSLCSSSDLVIGVMLKTTVFLMAAFFLVEMVLDRSARLALAEAEAAANRTDGTATEASGGVEDDASTTDAATAAAAAATTAAAAGGGGAVDHPSSQGPNALSSDEWHFYFRILCGGVGVLLVLLFMFVCNAVRQCHHVRRTGRPIFDRADVREVEASTRINVFGLERSGDLVPNAAH